MLVGHTILHSSTALTQPGALRREASIGTDVVAACHGSGYLGPIDATRVSPMRLYHGQIVGQLVMLTPLAFKRWMHPDHARSRTISSRSLALHIAAPFAAIAATSEACFITWLEILKGSETPVSSHRLFTHSPGRSRVLACGSDYASRRNSPVAHMRNFPLRLILRELRKGYDGVTHQCVYGHSLPCTFAPRRENSPSASPAIRLHIQYSGTPAHEGADLRARPLHHFRV
ncbi:hypothetical protein LshimejAT787_0505400 [Lyophyllum shimeji]|uniref:Uncharacterized protein n=1 Tax=Lyophyllum shimeji TaxID=47721 RepID=A0A9P3PML6_LYOSH|nr:hypothetical protein LshimejAT787_0505400 [Lyophyllum shimeji]